MDLIEDCISKIDMAKVYESVLKYSPKEFGIAIEKYAKRYNVPNAWRNPKYHIKKKEDGPITIDGENYIVSKLFFGTLELAVKTRIREEALINMKPILENENFTKLTKIKRDRIRIEYNSRFALALYKYYSKVRHQEVVASGETVEKPIKPNYESKDAFIESCIKSKLTIIYIDEYKALADF